jgi:hypothetical protein
MRALLPHPKCRVPKAPTGIESGRCDDFCVMTRSYFLQSEPARPQCVVQP